MVQSSGAWQRRAVKQKGRCHLHRRGRCRRCRRPVSSGIHYRIRPKPGSWEDLGWQSNPSRDQKDQARLTLVDLGIVGVGRKVGYGISPSTTRSFLSISRRIFSSVGHHRTVMKGTNQTAILQPQVLVLSLKYIQSQTSQQIGSLSPSTILELCLRAEAGRHTDQVKHEPKWWRRARRPMAGRRPAGRSPAALKLAPMRRLPTSCQPLALPCRCGREARIDLPWRCGVDDEHKGHVD